MRIFFSVGEPSGDVHGANLVKELRQSYPAIECVGFGGPKMQAAGCNLLADLTQLAVMFLWSVVKNYPTFRRYLKSAEQYFHDYDVDAVVLIDYPGFNWLIARIAKRHGIPVFYYGVPQIWAWAPWRIRKLRRRVDHVLCKLPFEPEWFSARGVKAHFVGHPFYDEVVGYDYNSAFIAKFNDETSERPVLLLLPGSRDSEVDRNGPTLLRAAALVKKCVPELRIVVGCVKESHVKRLSMEKPEHAEMFVQRTPELMKTASCCIACSGSVSLELMYHALPTVVVYKLGVFKSFLQRFLIRARYITLVNLMASNSIQREHFRAYNPDAIGAEQVPMPEYLTHRDCSKLVATRIANWLSKPDSLDYNRQALLGLRQRFGQTGATKRAAEYILDILTATTSSRNDQKAA